MAGRHWREAATLLLVGRASSKYKNGLSNSNYKNFKADWTPPDYKMLFLKRSSKSSFMPETYVFPGGTIDEADLNPKWLSIFGEHGYSEGDLLKCFRIPNNSPELYTNKASSEGLLPELAFRICALRETFEETGLLLASSAKHTSFASPFHSSPEELGEWRRKVHRDASQFLTLMQHIRALPSVFSLYEWVSWLTPTTFESPSKRFDTAFYIAFVDSEIPLHAHDKHEVDEVKVEGPFELLHSFQDGRISVAPPQVYELSRLLRCPTLETLKDFSVDRSTKGMSRVFPVMVQAQDGIIFTYPGDSLYPSEPDLIGSGEKESIAQTISETRESSVCVNRFEKTAATSPYSGRLVVKNITQPCGHLNPLTLSDVLQS